MRLRGFALLIAGGSVAAVAASSFVLVSSASAGHSITGSIANPTYWLCQNNKTNAETGIRTYTGTGTYPTCGSGYTIRYWSQVGPAGAKGDTGAQGLKGDTGAAGADGKDGKNAIESLTSFPDGSLNTAAVLHNVGGSIRTGVTDLGSVELDAGTYDAKVLATFYRKVNTSASPEWVSKQTYGTLVVWTGDTINAEFSNDTTLGGVLIPKVNSTTLTIDPGADLDATIKIAADGTPVHVGVFAYNDDSSSTGTASQPGAGTFSAVLQSASFEQLNVG